MARKKVTSSDVAEKAGVSQATVSMVLNPEVQCFFFEKQWKKVERGQRTGLSASGHKKKKRTKRKK